MRLDIPILLPLRKRLPGFHMVHAKKTVGDERSELNSRFVHTWIPILRRIEIVKYY